MTSKDFFISYNKADRTWAEWIAWTLEESGYSTSIQAWDFRPGGNFVLEMQKAAAETQRTIAVLSEDYLKAEYTQPEWAAAFARDPQGQERVLIPMRVKKCRPDGLLQAIIYVDLVDLSEAEARGAILGAFSDRAKPSQAPPFPGSCQPVAYPGSNKSETKLEPQALKSPTQQRLSKEERKNLINQLYAIPTQQFNRLLFELEPAPGLIPPMPASQGDRAFALLTWAEAPGGCGLLSVRQVLESILNPQ